MGRRTVAGTPGLLVSQPVALGLLHSWNTPRLWRHLAVQVAMSARDSAREVRNRVVRLGSATKKLPHRGAERRDDQV